MDTSSPSILGTWRLVAWESRSSEGTVNHPIGETTQERFYALEDDQLVLSTPPLTLGGPSSVSTLRWERMNPQ